MRMSVQRPRQHAARSAGVALGGVFAGATLVWLFDPQSGARRRTRLQQKTAHATREAATAVSATARDLARRAEGAAIEIRDRIGDARDLLRGRTVDDGLIVDRVRAELGRLSRHPGAIEVHSEGGRVELTGPVLRTDVQRVVRGVKHVRGVRDVVQRMRVSEGPEGVHALQGGQSAASRVPRCSRETGLDRAHPDGPRERRDSRLGGHERKGLVRVIATITGVTLLLRAVASLPARRLAGIGAGKRTILLQESFFVNAPVSEESSHSSIDSRTFRAS